MSRNEIYKRLALLNSAIEAGDAIGGGASGLEEREEQERERDELARKLGIPVVDDLTAYH